MIKSVQNQDLRLENLPKKYATWDKIVPFASTFNLLEMQDLTDALSQHRRALYTQYRCFNHFGRDPDAKEMREIYATLDAIRAELIRKNKEYKPT